MIPTIVVPPINSPLTGSAWPGSMLAVATASYRAGTTMRTATAPANVEANAKTTIQRRRHKMYKTCCSGMSTSQPLENPLVHDYRVVRFNYIVQARRAVLDSAVRQTPLDFDSPIRSQRGHASTSGDGLRYAEGATHRIFSRPIDVSVKEVNGDLLDINLIIVLEEKVRALSPLDRFRVEAENPRALRPSPPNDNRAGARVFPYAARSRQDLYERGRPVQSERPRQPDLSEDRHLGAKGRNFNQHLRILDHIGFFQSGGNLLLELILRQAGCLDPTDIRQRDRTVRLNSRDRVELGLIHHIDL